MSGIDLILTASNRAQARGYLHELRARRELGLLDRFARCMVVPDAGGRRVGSGTATLLALDALVRRIRRECGKAALSSHEALAQRCVIIVHSGGDSRRLIAYAAQGKIFTPLPCADRPPQASALFDLIADDLAGVEFPDAGGVLIASGDVLLGVSLQRLRFGDDAIAGVAWPTTPERGSRHGVYVVDAQGEDSRVREVLQKPDAATVRARGALDAGNRVLVDTGLVFLPPRDAARWLTAAAEMLAGRTPPPALDLYGETLPALVQRETAAASDVRVATFLGNIGGVGMRLHRIDHCLFFHIGTTRELLTQLTGAMPHLPCTPRVARTITGNACAIASSFIDACSFHRPPTLAGENVVVGVPASCAASIDLARGQGVVCLPLGRSDWTAIAFGMDDDFKTPRDRGGAFAGRSLASLDRACWREDDDQTLWSARLWRIGSATDAVSAAMALLRNPAHAIAQAGALHSAADVLAIVNQRRLLEHRRDVLREAAFREVALRVQAQTVFPAQPRRAAIARGQPVRVAAPVRIDLAGGWSDTPPICHDVGGAVVNVAVCLNGAAPISVSARLIDERLVRVRSIDLQREATFTSAAEVAQHREPGDWAALPKAALVLAGISPRESRENLRDWLEVLGGGVELTIASDLPKGSGLGASSILGAATLACLARIIGEELTREQLIARTSALEQMMSTAGGWQDQAGGITPGAKLLTTEPGPQQIPAQQPLSIPREFWNQRVLLYSTGMQRLARDILHNVVWRWVNGGPRIQRIVRGLRDGALRIRDDLQSGDVEAFARGVLQYWELKKAIDPGATNARIEALIDGVRPWLSGYELPGAGGGGFLFMIARDEFAAAHVRRHLMENPPNPQARFFDVSVDDVGLTSGPAK